MKNNWGGTNSKQEKETKDAVSSLFVWQMLFLEGRKLAILISGKLAGTIAIF